MAYEHMIGLNMGSVLRRVAKRYSNREVIIFEGERYTFSQFNSRVNQLARGLLDIGVRKSDKVAIFSRNCNEYLETYFACAKIGAIIVALNYRLSPGEIEYMTNHSDSKVLLLENVFQDFFSPLLNKINIKKDTILVIDGKPTLPGGVNYEDFISKYSADEPEDQGVKAEDPVLLLYTSGTTGTPKGALLTHANNIWDATSWWYTYEIRRGDKQLQAMPFIHVSGLHICTCANIYKGLPMALLRAWDPKEACRLIQEERCTYGCILVPMLQTITQFPDVNKYDFSSLRFVLTAAAKYTREFVYDAMYKLGVSAFYFGYGLTEACPVVTLTETTAETIMKENCLGYPGYYTDIRVVDEQGNDVPQGNVGELITRGPNVFAGYYKMPEETAKALRDGWLYTGDLVRMDEDGCVFFVDRKKDMIKSGGENVSATEVEIGLIKSNPEILEVAVIGTPDPKWGEKVVAYVTLKPGSQLTEKQMLDRARPVLAGYKLPKNVLFVSELPKSSSGKVRKPLLREMAPEDLSKKA